MNLYYLGAGLLSLALGITHSFLGEYLIFKHWRKKGALIPSKEQTALKERHARILWATWHLASLFGWCFSIIMMKIGFNKQVVAIDSVNFIVNLIAYTMIIGSLLVLIGTKGKHPGWVILVLIGTLLITAN